MLIQTEEKSVTLTPFGSLALNGTANASRGGGESWIEMIRKARFLKLTKAVRTNRIGVSRSGEKA
jgi:hypothetical protein